MSPSTIAVVGGSGFIGTQLVARLQSAGHRVRIPDVAPSQTFPDLRIDCDVRDLGRLTETLRGCDLVYNLAAEHRDNVKPRSLYDEVNVGGARNLCQAADRLGIRRLFFTSSVAVYGFSEVELDEDGPKRPINDYGRTKLEAEQVMQEWYRRAQGRTLFVVRPTVVFGPGNRGNVYTLMRQLAQIPYLTIGRGKNIKSMSCVENVAAFLEFALGLPPGEHIYNYIDKPDFDMEALVGLVRKWLGRESAPMIRLPYGVAYGIGLACDAAAGLTRRPLPVSAVRVRKFCGSTFYSSRRAMASGFVPPEDMPQALQRTFATEFGAVHGG